MNSAFQVTGIAGVNHHKRMFIEKPSRKNVWYIETNLITNFYIDWIFEKNWTTFIYQFPLQNQAFKKKDLGRLHIASHIFKELHIHSSRMNDHLN
jgi:hypothetical protein